MKYLIRWVFGAPRNYLKTWDAQNAVAAWGGKKAARRFSKAVAKRVASAWGKDSEAWVEIVAVPR